MPRVCQVMTWFCFSLAGVLLTVAMLALPENAFADTGGDCVTSCTALWTPGSPDYYTCLGNCCNGYSGGDSYLDGTCCSSACAGDSNPTACAATCGAGFGGGSCKTTNKNDDYCNKVCRVPSGSSETCTVMGSGGCNIEGDVCSKCKCDWRSNFKECLCW
jgi:hypothetical protein